MLTLISYDVVIDKRRTKVMKLLKGYGVRVQYSVFECHLSPEQRATLQAQLRNLIDLKTDSVRLYPLDASTARKVLVLGTGQVTLERLYYLVNDPAPS